MHKIFFCNFQRLFETFVTIQLILEAFYTLMEIAH